jgi:hypothetical protein
MFHAPDEPPRSNAADVLFWTVFGLLIAAALAGITMLLMAFLAPDPISLLPQQPRKSLFT